MKQIIATFVLAALLITSASCSKDETPAIKDFTRSINFTVKAKDVRIADTGKNVNFNVSKAYTMPDNNTVFIATNNELTANDHIYMMIKTGNCMGMETGSTLQVTYFSFCKPLSSDSHDYTNEYTGEIYLIKYPGYVGDDAIIRFNNVKCVLKGSTYGGSYTLNGDMKFKVVEYPLN